MIYLTRLNGERFLLNADLVQELESTPDTVVTLTTGKKFMVAEGVEAVRKAVIDYKHTIASGPLPPQGG
jgi:flagellar protein FlbD